MRFSSILASALTAAVAVVAQTGSTANPFTKSDYSGITAGTPITITWTPTTDGTVTIELVRGDPLNLNLVSVIQSDLENSGSYEWTPDVSIVQGSDYALKIIDDNDSDNYNYTPQFTIDSDFTSTSSAVPTLTTSDVETTTTAEPTTTTEEETSTTSTATDETTAEVTTDASTTLATNTTSDIPTTTTTQPSSTSSGAAATAKVGAGLVGFVGAAMLLL